MRQNPGDSVLPFYTAVQERKEAKRAASNTHAIQTTSRYAAVHERPSADLRPRVYDQSQILPRYYGVSTGETPAAEESGKFSGLVVFGVFTVGFILGYVFGGTTR